jgi:riboflavin kinase / FMN adenylyltransferase
MIIHEGYERLNLVTPVVTLGVFDGVHRGHKALLDCLVMRARESNGEAVVVTFSPHPRLVLDTTSGNLSFLTTMSEKKKHLEDAKVDHLVIIEFNKEFSKINACDFIREVLYEKIGTRHLLIGFNHRFGTGAEGDYKTLRKCAENLHFRVEEVKGYQTEDGAVSSSLIREALSGGKLEEANRWLGYRYSITGTVIEGRKIGRAIGFPTANIEPDFEYKLIPANGVYAVEALINGISYPGMLSIGVNPTINADNKRSIEVHILNFDMDIYRKPITVIFHKRLRDEIKFENKKDLSSQMMLDKEQVVQLLK